MGKDAVRILGVSGSPRKGGNTDALLDRAAISARSAGASMELVHLRDYVIQPCVGCEQCRKDLTCTRFYDGMHLLYPKIEQAKGLVLGSPTHHYNVTAWVKAFIDRLYPYYEFSRQRPGPWRSRLSGQGRVAVTFEVCEQCDPSESSFTLAALRKPLEALGYETLAEISVLGHFRKAAVREDPAALERVSSAMKRMAGEIGL
ncbi:MAG: flavodoxin family protein [Deferrisomatales bacterium]|nr:flavodoxin family protein [Deferrisomatales bacterium]